jgi:hypothetical protein
MSTSQSTNLGVSLLFLGHRLVNLHTHSRNQIAVVFEGYQLCISSKNLCIEFSNETIYPELATISISHEGLVPEGESKLIIPKFKFLSHLGCQVDRHHALSAANVHRRGEIGLWKGPYFCVL